MKALKRLRTAEFELRARNIGITLEALIAKKVEILEGMFVAKQSDDSIGVSFLDSARIWRLMWECCQAKGKLKYHVWVLLDFSMSP